MNKKQVGIGVLLTLVGFIGAAMCFIFGFIFILIGGWLLWLLILPALAVGTIGIIIAAIGAMGPDTEKMCWPGQPCWKPKLGK